MFEIHFSEFIILYMSDLKALELNLWFYEAFFFKYKSIIKS